MSIGVTNEVPRAIAGSVLMVVVMPSLWAVAATLGRPTSSARRAATVLTDSANAVSRVIGPRLPGSKLTGDQPLMVIGSSTTIMSGVRPASRAVR